MAPLGAAVVCLAALLHPAVGQYFPPTPQGVTTVKSRFNNGVTLSYKQVGYPVLLFIFIQLISIFQPGICETTDGVKSFSGYVTLPMNTLADVQELQNYTINT